MPTHIVRPGRQTDHSHLVTVVTAVIIIAALYFFKDLLVPFALALLLSFLLTPPVTWLEHLKIGRIAASLIVLAITFSIVVALVWLGTEQLTGIVSQLPRYETNIQTRLEAFGKTGGALTRFTSSIKRIENQVTHHSGNELINQVSPPPASASISPQPQPVQPVPVEVVHPQTGIFGSLGIISTSLVKVLGSAVAVIVLTLFILINRNQIRNRLFRLLGQEHLILVTTALDDAAVRVSRYLLTQSAVNGAFGTLLGLALYSIGLPFASFWAVFGAIMRFIPYVGTLIAGTCPFLLSLAVFQDWRHPLLVLGVFVGIECTTFGVVEPMLYAARTGISSLAILLSAAFWTLLWGPIGLILSTPLTVCLAVLGRHLPPLEFLHVLLGDEPVLPPEVHYYQRLLAMDEDEAAEVVDQCLKEKSLTEVYDSVIIPALQMTRQDRQRNRLDDERVKFIYQSTRELIEDLGVRTTPEELPLSSEIAILCLPAKNYSDELVALMAAQVARNVGFNASVLPADLGEERLNRVQNSKAEIFVVSALPPFALIHARSLCRNIRSLRPEAKIFLGLWNLSLTAEKIRERIGSPFADVIVTTLADMEREWKTLLTNQEKKQATQSVASHSVTAI
jgi:predicted PurR-regulated permease PerM